MDRRELNRLIARLRTLNRDAAGIEAEHCAAQMLPVADRFRTPADLAALWILSLGLYYAAATRVADEYGAATLARLVEERFAQLEEGAASEDVFCEAVPYPENLENYRRALTQLPVSLVRAAMESVLGALLQFA